MFEYNEMRLIYIKVACKAERRLHELREDQVLCE